MESAKELVNLRFHLHRLFRASFGEGIKHRDSHQRFGLVSLLEKRGPLGLKELSREMGISSSSLCIMMNRLEDMDLIRREEHPSDRRRTLYALTPQGARHLAEERSARLDAIAAEMDGWLPEERGEIVELSKRLSALLESRIDSE